MDKRTGRVVAVLGAVAALCFGLTGCAGAVAAENVEREIDNLVQRLGGAPADKVDCPDDLPAEVGASVRCSFTAQGATYGVTVTVTSIEGDTANYDIKVDDTPQR